MALLNINLHSTPRYKIVLLFSALFVIAVITGLVSLASGSVSVPLREVIDILVEQPHSINSQIILDLRLPRVTSGFVVGGMLALAGALMQILLRNPLAEPYILGISGGASVFALLAISMGLAGVWLTLGACFGALLTMFMVFVFSGSGSGWNPLKVLLTGVVIAAGWGAVISFLLAVSPAAKLHNMLFWLMGDLSFSQPGNHYFLVLILAIILAMNYSRALNLLAVGDLQAAALGVSVNRLRIFTYFLASILTATAVIQAGSIGFIGLIIPHAVRLVIGNDNRLLLPASVLAGGILLVFADMLARTLLAPRQLPVGVLTALIGVPVFLLLLRSTAARQRP